MNNSVCSQKYIFTNQLTAERSNLFPFKVNVCLWLKQAGEMRTRSRETRRKREDEVKSALRKGNRKQEETAATFPSRLLQILASLKHHKLDILC